MKRKLINEWKKRPKKYQLKPNETIVQLVYIEGNRSQTRHEKVKKFDLDNIGEIKKKTMLRAYVSE